jgi:hypothetical protein
VLCVVAVLLLEGKVPFIDVHETAISKQGLLDIA